MSNLMKKLLSELERAKEYQQMYKDTIKELEEIYRACNTERVWEIQNRLGELLKGLTTKTKVKED